MHIFYQKNLQEQIAKLQIDLPKLHKLQEERKTQQKKSEDDLKLKQKQERERQEKLKREVEQRQK